MAHQRQPAVRKIIFGSGFGDHYSAIRACVSNLYKDLVFKAASGELTLYFDIHQYGGRRIQVATVGVTLEQAREIKRSYLEIRDRLLKDEPDIDAVDFFIEPLDEIEIGAWPAKAQGILSLAKKSLHFELPLYTLLRTHKSREVYARLLTELLKEIALGRDSDLPSSRRISIWVSQKDPRLSLYSGCDLRLIKFLKSG